MIRARATAPKRSYGKPTHRPMTQTSEDRAAAREQILVEAGAVVILTSMLVQVGGIVGTILAALALLCALTMFSISPSRSASVFVRWGWLLVVPAFATMSSLWSLSPGVSLRYGAQLALTAAIGIFVAARLGPGALLRAVVISLSIFLVLGLFSGRQGISMQGPVLIGLAGSKNQLANAAQIAILAAFTLLFVKGTPALLRLWCLALVPISAFLLLQSNASGPLVVAVAGGIMLLALLPMQRVAPIGRVAALLGVAAIVVPFLAIGPEITAAAERFVVDVLGKDPTLTGRTVLWMRADEMIQERPLFGHGYMASWVGDHPIAVGLRSITGMQDGRGFNFHDTSRQLAVDLGFMGVGLFLVQIALSAIGSALRFVSSPSSARIFFVVFLAMTIVRMPTEVFIVPFSTTTILFFAACVFALSSTGEATGSIAISPRYASAGPSLINRRPRAQH